jgi:fructose-specific phosphotransferase system IIA component
MGSVPRLAEPIYLFENKKNCYFFRKLQMVLTQCLQQGCIKVPLEGKNKREVITELVNVLYESDLLLNKDFALEAILAREQLKSTGIGDGVAIPHGKCKAVKEMVLAMGITRQPIDFGSPDGKPVSIVSLLISPLEQTLQHLNAIADISRLMLNETLRAELHKTKTAQEAWFLLGGISHFNIKSDKSVKFSSLNYNNVVFNH